MELYHYTTDSHIESIIETGQLNLEGQNYIDVIKTRKYGAYDANTGKVKAKNLDDSPELEAMIRDKMIDYPFRYVWMSSNPIINTDTLSLSPERTDMKRIQLTIDTTNIKVYQWSQVMKVHQKKSLKLRAYVQMLNDIAVQAGDNPSDYWISKVPISMDNITIEESE